MNDNDRTACGACLIMVECGGHAHRTGPTHTYTHTGTCVPQRSTYLYMRVLPKWNMGTRSYPFRKASRMNPFRSRSASVFSSVVVVVVIIVVVVGHAAGVRWVFGV